jgi:hypothetical protein
VSLFYGKQLHVMLSAIVEFQRALLTSSSNINQLLKDCCLALQVTTCTLQIYPNNLGEHWQDLFFLLYYLFTWEYGLLYLEKELFTFRQIYYLPWATITNCCKLGGLYPLKFIFSQFWKPEVQSQGFDGAMQPLKTLGKILSLPFPTSDDCRHSFVYGCIIPI